MRIYCPNIKQDGIGGGWTFFRNFKKAVKEHVQFVDRWEDSDLVFVVGVTLVNPDEILKAGQAGKPVVFRVDNVPRKSRNRRQSPALRMKEIADIADVVVYQSEWAAHYCAPLCGEGVVITNGVDTEVFFPPVTPEPDRDKTFLFAYHGKSELKGFWTAHLIFQLIAREVPGAFFTFINDFGKEAGELLDSDFDFWNGERFTHYPKIDSPEEMADLMREHGTLIFPSVADAAPNTVLEARACGMKVIGAPPKELSGVQEMLEVEDFSLERMGEEYMGVFKLLIV